VPTLNGVHYDYYYEGYDEGINEDGPYVNATVICNWTDRFVLQNAFMGLTSVSGGPGGLLTITRPQQWPDSKNLWARDTKLIKALGEPRVSPNGGINYDKAVIGVSYKVPKFDVQGNNTLASIDQNPLPYFRQTIRTSDEEIPLLAGSLVFQGTTTPLQEPFHLQYPCAELVYTRLLLPYTPDPSIFAILNGVNNGTWNGFPKGYVRFSSINSTYEVQTDGSFASTVEYVFQAKNYDWNSVWSGTPADGFKKVWSDGTNQVTPYAYVSFDPIFAE
jgi:hypothetical protein